MAAIKVNFRQVSKYFFESYFDAFCNEIGKYITLSPACVLFLINGKSGLKNFN